MSQEYITLTRQDPDFEKYLLGTFSTSERALPVETYHAHTLKERVTFRVVKLVDLKVPPWWVVYFRSLRPELCALTLGPAIAAWLNHPGLIGDWTRWPSWFALLGIFFLHTAVFLYTDVQDHLRGDDRTNRKRGSRVIQKGWVTAQAMRQWAYVNLGLAVLFGVPAFLNAPLELAMVVASAAVLIVALTRGWAVRWGLSDLALGLLFGPLLTTGIALASYGHTDVTDAMIGAALGATAVWVFQVRQFENLFRSNQEMSRTMLGFLSFEQARALCVIEGFVLLALHPVVAAFAHLGGAAILITPLIGFPTMVVVQRLWRAASPLSSSLLRSSRLALIAHLGWAVWWITGLGLRWL